MRSVDKKVKKVTKKASGTAKTLSTVRKRNAKTQASLATAQKDIAAAVVRLTGAEGNVGLILAAAPQLATGLQTLATAVQTQIAPGLQTLASAYQSVEYGRAAISASGPGLAGGALQAPGAAVTSADIPDDGNTITTAADGYLAAGAGGTISIDLKASIRSAESDGDVDTKTAGQAGGFVQVSTLNGATIATCAAVPPAFPNPTPILGTIPGDTIVTPSGPVTNLPLKNIPGGKLRTDTTAPSTSLLPATCDINATAATLYKVHYSVDFVDIPTSTTPGATE